VRRHGIWRINSFRKMERESLNIVSAFEALGKFNNTIAPEDSR
jgi:hypothetical protein